ncbi:MAG: hypothetical protein ACK4NR_03240 [Micavibrio sp.]
MTDKTEDHKPDGRELIVFVYGLLTLSLICLFMPVLPILLTGLIMMLATLLLARILRLGKGHDHLVYNHMIYISRTISLWSLITAITTGIAGFLVIDKADNSLYQEMIDNMMQGHIYTPQESIEVMMNYISANMSLMIVAGIICFIPSMGYIIYRLSKGIGRALKGYRLANPKAWF